MTKVGDAQIPLIFTHRCFSSVTESCKGKREEASLEDLDSLTLPEPGPVLVCPAVQDNSRVGEDMGRLHLDRLRGRAAA